ncbi:1,4-dihydroxy-2-naphthoate octaprenyltransferase [Enterobacter cancerogenus]|uniref:1,4-dihydroxy-2-naphthoate octaprenyltransferase n=1 Tax=Enterobacter cancerogenus TaxID=69218 RepID=A0A484YSH6_9ENTR|nr:1,4-dihydroxy-2-naphthoate octaprenyltransferase [Enterobacter cancerogenus]
MGSWYLQTHTLIPALFLPATACGLLATAVLNINNLRDIDSDRVNGKNTLAVRLGPGKRTPLPRLPADGGADLPGAV